MKRGKTVGLFEPKSLYEIDLISMAYCRGIDISFKKSLSHQDKLQLVKRRIREESAPIPTTSSK